MHNLKYSQRDVLKGILANNAGILRYVYKVYYPSIRQHIISNFGSEDDAKDVFQESLIVLYRKLKDPEFKLSSSLKTYLYAIARLVWLKQRKKHPRLIEIKDTYEHEHSTDPGIIDTIEYNERMILFREKFEELSGDCRRVLKMFLNNLPIREITRAMGYKSDQHTKNRRFRCKMSLIQRIQSSEKYKELGYENTQENSGIPRW